MRFGFAAPPRLTQNPEALTRRIQGAYARRIGTHCRHSSSLRIAALPFPAEITIETPHMLFSVPAGAFPAPPPPRGTPPRSPAALGPSQAHLSPATRRKREPRRVIVSSTTAGAAPTPEGDGG